MVTNDTIILHLCNKLQVFTGNSNQNGIIKNNLQEFASAKFIRFWPTAFSGWKALRVEVYGIIPTKGNFFFHRFLALRQN